MNLQSLFVDLHGRISRRPFWLGAVALMVLSSLLYNAISQFTGGRIDLPHPDDISKMPLDEFLRIGSSRGFYVSSGLIFFIVSIPLAAKRLHDRNKSAWWVLFFYFGPFVLSYGIEALSVLDVVRGLGSLAILLWGIVELGILRGTVGPNRFGPDPLADAAAASTQAGAPPDQQR